MKFELANFLVRDLIEKFSFILEILDDLIAEEKEHEKAREYLMLHHTVLWNLEDLDRELDHIQAQRNYGCTGALYTVDNNYKPYIKFLTELPEEVITHL